MRITLFGSRCSIFMKSNLIILDAFVTLELLIYCQLSRVYDWKYMYKKRLHKNYKYRRFKSKTSTKTHFFCMIAWASPSNMFRVIIKTTSLNHIYHGHWVLLVQTELKAKLKQSRITKLTSAVFDHNIGWRFLVIMTTIQDFPYCW